MTEKSAVIPKGKIFFLLLSGCGIVVPLIFIYFQISCFYDISFALLACSLLSTRIFLNALLVNQHFCKVFITILLIYALYKLISPIYPEDEKTFFNTIIAMIYGLDIRQYIQDFYQPKQS